MGYKTSYLNWINDQIGKVYDSTNGLKMLELGNQVIRPDKQITETTGKAYFTRLGYEHTSVDLNGLDGALVKDLSKLEDFTEFKNYFILLEIKIPLSLIFLFLTSPPKIHSIYLPTLFFCTRTL